MAAVGNVSFVISLKLSHQFPSQTNNHIIPNEPEKLRLCIVDGHGTEWMD